MKDKTLQKLVNPLVDRFLRELLG